jgi:hypothetical protein
MLGVTRNVQKIQRQYKSLKGFLISRKFLPTILSHCSYYCMNLDNFTKRTMTILLMDATASLV